MDSVTQKITIRPLEDDPVSRVFCELAEDAWSPSPTSCSDESLAEALEDLRRTPAYSETDDGWEVDLAALRAHLSAPFVVPSADSWADDQFARARRDLIETIGGAS